MCRDVLKGDHGQPAVQALSLADPLTVAGQGHDLVASVPEEVLVGHISDLSEPKEDQFFMGEEAKIGGVYVAGSVSGRLRLPIESAPPLCWSPHRSPSNRSMDKLIAVVFGIPADAVHDDLAFDDIATWDSLTHMQLITALEDSYKGDADWR